MNGRSPREEHQVLGQVQINSGPRLAGPNKICVIWLDELGD